MRKRLAQVGGLVGLAAALTAAGASTASAQERVIAHVPFSFVVGDVRLPAGEYTVEQQGEDPAVLSIESADRAHEALVVTIRASELADPTSSHLEFRRVENEYFLSRIVSTDAADEREVPLTDAIMQRELARASGVQ